ncbi:MAG TPA: carboxypeptidase-like regulatory domain-containing protein, partial [Myxococcota bacterium]
MRIRLLLLPTSLSLAAFSACNCDPDLYSYPGTLTGLVCATDTGAALGNGTITIKDGDVTKDITLDQAGDFSQDKLPSGDATITIHETAGDRSVKVEIDSGKTSRFSDSTCHAPPPAPGGEIDGCVCDDASGTWEAGAQAYVVTTDGAVFNATTDTTGCFKLPGVAVGDQTVKVQKGTFYKEFDNVAVVAGQTVSVPSPATCEPAPPPPGSGTVSGRVCASDGTTWLAGATVQVTRADGTVTTTTTDGNGAYTLVGVPVGAQTVDITKGSFSTSIQVNVTADQTTVVPDDQCAITNPAVKIAVVTGEYDQVETVLGDLGVNPSNITTYDGADVPTQWNTQLLDDFATLSQYDIVFFNCGLDDNPLVVFHDPTAIANLQQFVQNGGSVYASDWAFSLVETAWPNEIDFVGTDNVYDEFAGTGPKVGIPSPDQG